MSAVDANELSVGIDFTTGQRGAAGDAHGGDTTTFTVSNTGEHFEGDIFEGVGDFSQFERDAEIRLVGAKAMHGFSVGHAREVWQINVDGFFENGADQFFGERSDFSLRS